MNEPIFLYKFQLMDNHKLLKIQVYIFLQILNIILLIFFKDKTMKINIQFNIIFYHLLLWFI